MSLYEEVLREIEEKKNRKEKGLFNGIPWPYPKWRDFIPSIDKGMYLGLLAPSGVGKSRFVRSTFVYDIYEFSKAHDYPVKILYFALEDAKKSVYKKMICHYMWERHQFDLHPSQLDSKYVGFDSRYLEIMSKDRKFFQEFEEDVYIINSASTPSEIMEACTRVHKVFGATHHIIVIVDNFSNVTKDAHHKTEWEAVRELSRNHIRLKLCKELDMTVIAVLQTDIETDKNTFRNVEKMPISALEPNTSSIGDIKVIVRDFYLLLGLFYPWKYEIKRYPYHDGYNVEILRNKFRALLMLKNNEGEMAPRLPLMFDGKKETFTEMPDLKETDTLNSIYAGILSEETKRKEMAARRSLLL